MDSQQENELFQTLGRIEAKVQGISNKNKEQHVDITDLSNKLDDKFNALPCETNYKLFQNDIKKKVDLKMLIAAVSILLFIVGGSYAYTTIVETKAHEHQINMDIHHTTPPIYSKRIKK